PDVVEDFNEAVAVKSQTSGYIYTDLKETGADTQIFRNSIADRGELLYLFTEDIDDYPATMDPDKIKVMNEEVLYFYLTIPPGNTSNYKWSEDVMVDRAEIGVEWQDQYAHYNHATLLEAYGFSEELYEGINTSSGTTWFKNFKYEDLDSQKSHWYYNSDSGYTDSVDIAAWAGHGTNPEWEHHVMYFFKDDWPWKEDCVLLYWTEIDWGDLDADWVFISTCSFLHGSDNDLKQLVSSVSGEKCAHLICSFTNISHVHQGYGTYLAEQLGKKSIKQAWFKYCDNKQQSGTTAKVFGAEECMDDSLAGPGPIKVSRNPTIESTWTSETYTKP
ncbi:MAG: DUF6345 domain-containing protein, partial [Phycisphaerae bacterium]|nr:DUF6345 domain-containing protein [Phycisphaerae bacterium]